MSCPRPGRLARSRRHVLAVSAAAAVVAIPLGLVAGPAGAGAAGASTSKSGVQVQSGNAPFGSCGASDIEMLVTIPRTSFTRAQPVNVSVLVRDIGKSTCNFQRPGPVPAPGSPAATENVSIGPCGAMAMEVKNKKGTDIWPGKGFFSCPLLSSGGGGLEPGKTLTASGTWDQEAVVTPSEINSSIKATGSSPGQKLAPKGAYTLVIDNRFTFHLRLR
jgi:hypothetical protein